MILAGLKVFLEKNAGPNVVRDRFPNGLGTHQTGRSS